MLMLGACLGIFAFRKRKEICAHLLGGVISAYEHFYQLPYGIKIGEHLHTPRERMYIPQLAWGIYSTRTHFSEGHVHINSLLRKHTYYHPIIPPKVGYELLVDGKRYPYAHITNGPAHMHVTIVHRRKRHIHSTTADKVIETMRELKS